ncbi:hypothetical protein Q7C18_02735 [Nesterenkonia sp. CL21]|uniref:hypothetical protein n=1 Tax=Nesterenkonia sp. CL21 TaxID=3064894 RepID=UPI00287B3755|nr:hypothetical protein [Nesterenkonia sp. CL21]MDS2171605.1 hypothetical protein [Nesterenkonia sp. CL21]
MTTVPNVDEGVATDPDIMLWINAPDTPARESVREPIRYAFDISASYGDGSEHNALTFSTYKDDPAVAKLATGNYEIVLRWWDPRREAWLEPPNSRFMVMKHLEDMVDETNKISFTCVSISWLLEKIRVRVADQFNTAVRLNRELDQAQERYDEAESEYESLMSQFDRTAKRVQEAHWPDIYHGPNWAVRGVTWIARQGKARGRSIVSDAARNGSLWWYSTDRGKFVRLSMTSGDSMTQSDKETLRELGPQIDRARRAMRRAQSNLASAQRAARESSRNGTRHFHNRTPGRVLTTLWREGIERDAGYVNHGESTPGWPDSPYALRVRIAKGIYRAWTSTHDSKDRAWTSFAPQQNWEIPLNSSIWDVIQDFREKGILDWQMGGIAPGGGGRNLRLVRKGGLEVDQTRRVSLRLGVDVLEAPQEVDHSEHQTVSFVLDSTGLNRYTYRHRDRAANQTPWGLWEGGISESDATDLDTAISLTQEERDRRANRYVIDSSRQTIVRPSGPLPMLDYQPGHTVTVYDHDGNAPRKVTQIIVEKKSDEDPIVATVRLGTRTTNRPVKYARTLNKITGGSDHIQGLIPMNPALDPGELPQSALRAPEITSLGASVRFNEAGRPQVHVSAQVSTADVPVPEDAELYDDAADAEDYMDDEEYEGA